MHPTRNTAPLSLMCVLTRSQELASPRPHRRPEVGRELLGVLVLQDELGYSPFPQRPARTHSPHTALLLHQLAVHQGHQLPLHGPTKHARTQGRHTCSGWHLCGKTVCLWSLTAVRAFTLVISQQRKHRNFILRPKKTSVASSLCLLQPAM